MAIKLIIVDDHKIFIDGLKALLKDVPEIKVIGEAYNGKQALNKVSELNPNIVLSDIQMPEMNGIETTHAITQDHPNTRIIALSMLSETVSIKKMLEAGAYGYILKTADKDELIRAIKVVAGGTKYFSEEITGQLMNNYTDTSSEMDSPLDVLTRREKEILTLIAKGLTDKEIAEQVFLSPLTVITHRKNILSKLQLKNKVELTRFAIKNQLVT